MMTFWLLRLVVLIMIVKLGLRWLAIVQQKEYRRDRIRVWWSSGEARKERERWVLVVPLMLVRVWKRPVQTVRMVVVGMAVAALGIWFWWSWGWSVWGLMMVYFLLPILILAVVIVSEELKSIVVKALLWLVRRELKKSKPTTVLGITGSYGKTSTKWLAAQLLGTRGVFVVREAVNTPLAVAIDILRRYEGEKTMMVEFAAYREGEIAELSRAIRPTIAMVTGLAPQHVGLFGSMNHLIKAKSELLEALNDSGIILAHEDETPWMKKMMKPYVGRVVWYGRKDLSEVTLDTTGHLMFTRSKTKYKTPLVGEHYAANLSGAMLVAKQLGVIQEMLDARLSALVLNDRFVTSSKVHFGLLVDDGRTANPFGFEAMVKLSRSLDYKTKVLVFGGIVDLGAESKVIHEKLFILAESVFDRIVYVGEEGKMSALSVFGNRLVPANKALDYLEGIFHTTLVVVEGYVPASLKRLFESWKKE